MKKTFLFIAAFVGIAAFSSIGNSGTNNQNTVTPPLRQVAPIEAPKEVEQAPVVAPIVTAPVKEVKTQLSNNNYYQNVNGNTVHAPAYSNTVPAGATAICRDGTYSFSQNQRGTCSHHGGVDQWL